MSDYDDRLELAPRDVVSQSIVRQMEKTQHPCVYLTMKHLDAASVRARFPGIAQVCRNFGLDIATDQIPVRPGAHYMIGGATVDGEGRSSLDGLWAAGEVTSSGLHGANRLASNSLLEGLVFGAKAGRGASKQAQAMPDHLYIPSLTYSVSSPTEDSVDVADVRNAVQSLMWRSVGVERSAERLQDAVSQIQRYCRYVLRHPFDTQAGWELQNLLTVSLMMATSALAREESRGVHLRTDFPKPDDEHWLKHLIIQLDSQN